MNEYVFYSEKVGKYIITKPGVTKGQQKITIPERSGGISIDVPDVVVS